jgi:hypothetical protein
MNFLAVDCDILCFDNEIHSSGQIFLNVKFKNRMLENRI